MTIAIHPDEDRKRVERLRLTRNRRGTIMGIGMCPLELVNL